MKAYFEIYKLQSNVIQKLSKITDWDIMHEYAVLLNNLPGCKSSVISSFKLLKTLSLKVKHPVDVNCDTNNIKLFINRIVILQKWSLKAHTSTTTGSVHQTLPHNQTTLE